MPARNRVPSFQIASGTANERDNSYNIPTGSIFFNTDTSNIELSGNVVAPMIDVSTSVTAATINATTSVSAPSINAASISFDDGSSPVKTTGNQDIHDHKTFRNVVTIAGSGIGDLNLQTGYSGAWFYSGHNGAGSSKYVYDGCKYRKVGEFFLLSVNYAGHGIYNSQGFLTFNTHSIRVNLPGYSPNWHESGSGVTSGGAAIYTQGTQYINLRSSGGQYTRGTFLLKTN